MDSGNIPSEIGRGASSISAKSGIGEEEEATP